MSFVNLHLGYLFTFLKYLFNNYLSIFVHLYYTILLTFCFLHILQLCIWFSFSKSKTNVEENEVYHLHKMRRLFSTGFVIRIYFLMVYDICIEATLGTWSAVYLDSPAISYQLYSVLRPVLIAQTSPLILL